MKRKPGSVTSGIFLVAGTTVQVSLPSLQSHKMLDFWPLQLHAFFAGYIWTWYSKTNVLYMFVLVLGLYHYGRTWYSKTTKTSGKPPTLCIQVSMAMRTLAKNRSPSVWLVLCIHTLCPSCCLCGSFFRYLDKCLWHSMMGECNFVFCDFWRHFCKLF